MVAKRLDGSVGLECVESVDRDKIWELNFGSKLEVLFEAQLHGTSLDRKLHTSI